MSQAATSLFSLAHLATARTASGGEGSEIAALPHVGQDRVRLTEAARTAAYAAARAYVLDKNPQTHAAYQQASKAWLALLDLSKGAKA